MRFLIAVVTVLTMNSVSSAENSATRFKITDGHIVIAQSYCGICSDNAMACRLACNGSGVCIQACDDALRDCREQNCGFRRR